MSSLRVLVLAAAVLACLASADDKTKQRQSQTTPSQPPQSTGTVQTAEGTEGGACYGNGTCNEGLTCASSLCVRLSGSPPAGSPAATTPASQPAPAPAAPSSSKTTRPDIQAGLEPVRPQILACDQQHHYVGVLDVKVTIAADGTVSSASVVGEQAGTPGAACVERAIAAARFKKADAATTVNLPFQFR